MVKSGATTIKEHDDARELCGPRGAQSGKCEVAIWSAMATEARLVMSENRVPPSAPTSASAGV